MHGRASQTLEMVRGSWTLRAADLGVGDPP